MQSEPKMIDYLATLPDLEYEQNKKKYAEKLKIAPSALDKLVNKKKRQTEGSNSSNCTFKEVIQYPEPVDGKELLNRIETACQRFVICDKSTRTTVCLWIAITWLTDVVDNLPIANITAPEKNCGKTTLLNFLGKLVKKPLPTNNITSSALFRSIEKWQPTLLIDEADSFADDDDSLRGIINAGHTRDSAFVIRCMGDDHEPTKFSVWSAKAIAGIGNRASTIESRSINLKLRRKKPNESTERMKKGKAEFKVLPQMISRWTNDIRDKLKHFEPDLPPAIQNRDADNWEPLIAIADCAGGDWPERARKAALELTQCEQSLSFGLELLTDIETIFDSKRLDKIFTAVLLEALNSMEDAPWATYSRGRMLNARSLARILKKYSIKSKEIRIGIMHKKGYALSDFTSSFDCYLFTPISSATTRQTSTGKAYKDNLSATTNNNVADDKTLQPNSDNGCRVVADKKGGNGDEYDW